MKIIYFVFAMAILFSACANEQPNESTTSEKLETNNTVAPLNPNGDSELALLMRNMENHWKETKKLLEENQPIKDIPDFSSLLTATPTDESMGMDDLQGLANAYLHQIKLLGSTEGTDQKKAYNNIINSCVVCHDNSCSGPIPRIQKLLIKE